ncbi:hypothetical protein ACJX0J_033336, partial [Zea mays]
RGQKKNRSIRDLSEELTRILDIIMRRQPIPEKRRLFLLFCFNMCQLRVQSSIIIGYKTFIIMQLTIQEMKMIGKAYFIRFRDLSEELTRAYRPSDMMGIITF